MTLAWSFCPVIVFRAARFLRFNAFCIVFSLDPNMEPAAPIMLIPVVCNQKKSPLQNTPTPMGRVMCFAAGSGSFFFAPIIQMGKPLAQIVGNQKDLSCLPIPL